MMAIRKGDNLKNKKTGKLYKVRRFEGDKVFLESKGGKGELLVNRLDINNMYSRTLSTKLYNLARIIIWCASITCLLLGVLFLYLMSRARGDAFEAHGMMAVIFFHIAIILPLLFYAGVWIYKGITWIRNKF